MQFITFTICVSFVFKCVKTSSIFELNVNLYASLNIKPLTKVFTACVLCINSAFPTPLLSKTVFAKTDTIKLPEK